ncbi:intraflagellar transport protein 140 homolog [Bacillus rossius redtenbacheri]|uniref:intraflagellar transport protein 140 homolog n=1 Tax=Bacillus rossius redtenbacheri TaxID=93214 RepID=UPI002FDEF961
MSLYFDYKVQSPDPSSININMEWHPQHHILAVASFSQEKGGFVTLFDELGDVLEGVACPSHPVAQATALAWHPSKKLLVTGWEDGELRLWAGEREFASVQSAHRAPVTVLQWSEQGGRLVSGDTAGSLVCSKLDSRNQVLSVIHHELKDALTHIAFRRSPPGIDISGLARAAVAGDERALDLFSAWRPRTAGQRVAFQSGGDNLCFYVSSVSGMLYYVSEEGSCAEVLNTDGSVFRRLLYHERKDCLVVMTEGLNVGQFSVDAKGQLTEVMKVKLSGRSQDATMAWAGVGVLAVITGDLSVRCWDLESGENYLLPGPAKAVSAAAAASSQPAEVFTSLGYCPQKRMLCAGTNLGGVLMWKHVPPVPPFDPGPGPSAPREPWRCWVAEPPCSVRGAVKQVSWARSEPLLAVNTVSCVYVLREQALCAHFCRGVSVVQVAPSRLVVEASGEEGARPGTELSTDLQVCGVAAGADHVAVWSNKTLAVYQLLREDGGLAAKVLGSFACEAAAAACVFEDSVVTLDQDKVSVRTFHGTVKQALPFSDAEGQPICMQLCGGFLVVATSGGVLKLWDLTRREARLHCQPKSLGEVLFDFGEVILARCNSNGTKVSISIAKSNFLPDSKLFVWDVETDALDHFDFARGAGGAAGVAEEEEEGRGSLSPEPGGNSALHDLSDRFVLGHQWEESEPRLLVCEAKLLPRSRNYRRASTTVATVPAGSLAGGGRRTPDQASEVVLVTLFTSPEAGLMVQDVQPLPDDHSQLLGVSTPHYVLLNKPSAQVSGGGLVRRVTMRDFEGIGACDKATRDAVLNFSYHLTVGNMDEAFRAIKTIRSEAVWESLARMCVKTKRLDVAMVCLGHMRHARGAMAVRQAVAREPELEARVAVLAAQLGLVEEAERLLEGCGRHDLLNSLLQAAGEWDRALRVAEDRDRVHLRATCHSHARHLEAKGELAAAAGMYERAGTHRAQVPRMLADRPDQLRAYVAASKDPQLTRWWGQLMESSGSMDEAVSCYQRAGDFFSLVRVLCFQDDLENASQVASATGDRAACYHLARRYESLGLVKEAVHFFTTARAYANAIRLCKEQHLADSLWTLAQLAGPREQLEAARYFERCDPPAPERAVLLYHRAGKLHKALDLAFRTQQYNALQLIAVDLNSTSDPALIAKCARFFVDNQQYDKAVDLLAVGKQHEEALQLCREHGIEVTEDLAEKLTPEKGEGDEAVRARVLEGVAECALAQGNYHLATKKFTQAGNKVKAMKALLKSGDTEKIVFFANVSRQREIYVMAGNYLQSLDWKGSPDVLRNIVAFYTKGRAPELLANFYVACAQAEVDVYQNYEKALGALGEAHRCLSKVTSPRDPLQHQRAVEELEARTALVSKFLDIRRLLERGDAPAALGQCRQLLQGARLDAQSAVRKGDVLALMIQHHTAAGAFRDAQRLVEEFRHACPGTSLAHHVPAATIDKIARGVGLPVDMLVPRAGAAPPDERSNAADDDEDEVPEEEEQGPAEPADIDRAGEGFMNGRAYAV